MKILNPEGMYHSQRYYSGLRAGNMIFTAGRVPIDLEGNVVAPNDAAKQTEVIMEDLQKILAEGGATLQALGAARFVETSAADYEPVFEMARIAGVALGADRAPR